MITGAQVQPIGQAINYPIPVLMEASYDESISIVTVGKKKDPCTGTLYSGCSNCNAIVPNTKVTFIKNNYRAVSPFNIVYDYTYTDNHGQYTAFLETGDYKIRVDINGRSNYYNQHIDGIEEYYEYVEKGCIKEKIEDTILFYGTDKALVSGCLYDEYDHPYNGQIIISQGNQLVAFVKDAEYQFLLDYGIYDIRLRSDKQSVKIINNFVFSPGQGFFSQITDKIYTRIWR